MKQSKKWLAVFGAVTLASLVSTAALVIYVDPFFQYHKPLEDFPYVLDNQLSQNPGMAKNLDYDSVLLGSSMVVQFNTAWFEEIMGLNTVKLAYNAAHAKDQDIILKVVEEHHEDLKAVFLGIDIPNYSNGVDDVSYPVQKSLYDDNYLNDVDYWWNKDVLLNYVVGPWVGKEEADDFHTIYGKYYYAEYYNEEHVLSSYVSEEKVEEEVPEDAFLEAAARNMNTHILPYIERNPDTEYYVFFPPYSILFWHNARMRNNVDARMAEYRQIIEMLLPYDNVRIFFFANNEDIICDLDNYVDYTHYSREINLYMVQCFADGGEEVTEENYQEEIEKLRSLVESFDFSRWGLE